MERSSISKAAQARIPATITIAEQFRGRRGIVFHEYIKDAVEIADALERRGHRVRLYHSQLYHVSRSLNLHLFRSGQIDILVTCTALDEGLDVPGADFAIIASSSRTRRQRIQRLGRVIRSSTGKDKATVVTLYALPSEGERLAEEIQSLNEVASVRWFDAVRP